MPLIYSKLIFSHLIFHKYFEKENANSLISDDFLIAWF